MKNQFFAEGKLNEISKAEWMGKEEGSWEDYQKNSDTKKHVHQILYDSAEGKWQVASKEEAETLLRSAEYQQHWDDPDDYTKRMMKAAKQISLKLKRLLNK